MASLDFLVSRFLLISFIQFYSFHYQTIMGFNSTSVFINQVFFIKFVLFSNTLKFRNRIMLYNLILKVSFLTFSDTLRSCSKDLEQKPTIGGFWSRLQGDLVDFHLLVSTAQSAWPGSLWGWPSAQNSVWFHSSGAILPEWRAHRSRSLQFFVHETIKIICVNISSNIRKDHETSIVNSSLFRVLYQPSLFEEQIFFNPFIFLKDVIAKNLLALDRR